MAIVAEEQKQEAVSVAAICVLFDIVLTMAYLNTVANYGDSTFNARVKCLFSP